MTEDELVKELEKEFPKPKELRLVIGIPSGPDWSALFAISCVHMTADLSHQIPGYDSQAYVLYNKRGSILPQLRQSIVEAALKQNATHLLFIDSDQTFPADLARRLLRHNQLVVAANVATKMIPSSPTARVKGKTMEGEPLWPDVNKDIRLARVWRVGTGVMLINMEVFKRLGPGPWFTPRWEESLGSYVGEDWVFCEHLQKAGIPIYVDTNISWEIGHVGSLEYNLSLVQKDAFHSESEE